MLIMRYNGGLGNQMFQYAAVASLANKLNTDFYFDCDFFNQRYSRPYQMDIFQEDKREIDGFKYKALWALRRYVKDNFFGLNVYREDDFNWEERFDQIHDNTYIYGFFQSHKYINEELIKKLFSFRYEPSTFNLELINKIHSEDSISMHIRRGDYVQKKRYASVYNHLDFNYYSKALEIIADKVQSPKIYVFSDDIEWVKENFSFNNCPKCIEKKAIVEFVSHNQGASSWEDLRLMSKCKHNIIANSSFSWWGAYLNSNPNKMVVAPEKWFQKIQNNPRDLYPDSWILL